MTALEPIEYAAFDVLGLRRDPDVLDPLAAEYDALGELGRQMPDPPNFLPSAGRVGAVGWIIEDRRRLVVDVRHGDDAEVLVRAEVGGMMLTEQIPVADVHLLVRADWIILDVTPIAPRGAIFVFAVGASRNGSETWHTKAVDFRGAANLLASERWTTQLWYEDGTRRTLGDVVASSVLAGGGMEGERAKRYHKLLKSPQRARRALYDGLAGYLSDQPADDGPMVSSWEVFAITSRNRVVVDLGATRALPPDPPSRHFRARTQITSALAIELSGRTRLDRADSSPLRAGLPSGWGKMLRGLGTVTQEEYLAATDAVRAAVLRDEYGHRWPRQPYVYRDPTGDIAANLADGTLSVGPAVELTSQGASRSTDIDAALRLVVTRWRKRGLNDRQIVAGVLRDMGFAWGEIVIATRMPDRSLRRAHAAGQKKLQK